MGPRRQHVREFVCAIRRRPRDESALRPDRAVGRWGRGRGRDGRHADRRKSPLLHGDVHRDGRGDHRNDDAGGLQLAPARWGTGTTTPPSGQGPLYFEQCAEAWEAGEAPIERGEPGYRDELDRDKDGTACEPSPEIAPSTTNGPVE
ncbi:excalibur calcium-binding domain-containing protein [Streptodolium elevatio]|uniref:Excalibur calcium-binding domain-containing protein n=1 Tax=Streptodolium elevatio TaxID=3157996 RepID=A0ABV3DLI0_9ACTN